MYAKKLGFGALLWAAGSGEAAEAAEDAQEVARLWERMEQLMRRGLGERMKTEANERTGRTTYDGGVDWTIVWRQLAALPPLHLRRVSMSDSTSGSAGSAADTSTESSSDAGTESSTDLSTESSTDVTWEVVDSVLEEGAASDERLFAPIAMAFYAPPSSRLLKKWCRWLRDWLEALSRSINSINATTTSSTTIDKDATSVGVSDEPSTATSTTRVSPPPAPPVAIAMAMKRVSPKYIPREWMLKLAYDRAYGHDGHDGGQGDGDDNTAYDASLAGGAPTSAASNAGGTGNRTAAAEFRRHRHTVIRTLQRIFRRPYDEHSKEDEDRFYRRAPAGSLKQGGVGFMS
jgi:hypothetical protein